MKPRPWVCRDKVGETFAQSLHLEVEDDWNNKKKKLCKRFKRLHNLSLINRLRKQT